jgi:hypothetical protein
VLWCLQDGKENEKLDPHYHRPFLLAMFSCARMYDSVPFVVADVLILPGCVLLASLTWHPASCVCASPRLAAENSV